MMITQKLSPKVLVVEDDPTAQRYLEKLLEKNGMEVKLCNNGAEGLYYFISDQSFDVVVLDLMLPKVTGEDFLKVAEDLHTRKLIPGPERIIICTAVKAFAEIKQLTQLECVHCLIEKPIQSQQLLDNIIDLTLRRREMGLGGRSEERVQ